MSAYCWRFVKKVKWIVQNDQVKKMWKKEEKEEKNKWKWNEKKKVWAWTKGNKSEKKRRIGSLWA